jgi:hypothetical protein
MRNETTGIAAGAMIIGLALIATPALAGPRLQFGKPRLAAGGTEVSVPVRLKARRADDVAALNFTLRYDPAGPVRAVGETRAGSTVRRARAELASATDTEAGTVRVLVMPEFQEHFATMRSGSVASVRLSLPDPAPRGSLGRWVRRHVKIEDVVLASSQATEIVPASGKGGGNASTEQ